MQIPIFGISIWVIAKIFAIFGLVLYLVFALVVVRQVKLMTDTLEVGFELPIRILAYAHLIFAILVLLAAFVIL